MQFNILQKWIRNRNWKIEAPERITGKNETNRIQMAAAAVIRNKIQGFRNHEKRNLQDIEKNREVEDVQQY